MVRGLEEKCFLNHEQFGNTYRYFAIISREEFRNSSIKNLVSKYFNASYSSVVSMFVEEQKISTEEIKELIRQVESGKIQNNE
jgi:BlaI family transcriptional regulator, penicillinase repressor